MSNVNTSLKRVVCVVKNVFVKCLSAFHRPEKTDGKVSFGRFTNLA